MDFESLKNEYNDKEIKDLKTCIGELIIDTQEEEIEIWKKQMIVEYELRKKDESHLKLKEELIKKFGKEAEQKANQSLITLLKRSLEDIFINMHLLSNENISDKFSEISLNSLQGSIYSNGKSSGDKNSKMDKIDEVESEDDEKEKPNDEMLKADINRMFTCLKQFPKDIGENIKKVLDKYNGIDENLANKLILEGIDDYRRFITNRMKSFANQTFMAMKKSLRPDEKISNQRVHGHFVAIYSKYINTYQRKDLDMLKELTEIQVNQWNRDCERIQNQKKNIQKNENFIKAMQQNQEQEINSSSNFQRTQSQRPQQTSNFQQNANNVIKVKEINIENYYNNHKNKPQEEKFITQKKQGFNDFLKREEPKFEGERPPKVDKKNDSTFKFKRGVNKEGKKKPGEGKITGGLKQQTGEEKFMQILQQNEKHIKKVEKENMEKKIEEIHSGKRQIDLLWEQAINSNIPDWFKWRFITMEFDLWQQTQESVRKREIQIEDNKYVLSAEHYLRNDFFREMNNEDHNAIQKLQSLITDPSQTGIVERITTKIVEWEQFIRKNNDLSMIRKCIFETRFGIRNTQEQTVKINEFLGDAKTQRVLGNYNQLMTIDQELTDLQQRVLEDDQRKKILEIEQRERQKRIEQLKMEQLKNNEQKSDIAQQILIFEEKIKNSQNVQNVYAQQTTEQSQISENQMNQETLQSEQIKQDIFNQLNNIGSEGQIQINKVNEENIQNQNAQLTENKFNQNSQWNQNYQEQLSENEMNSLIAKIQQLENERVQLEEQQRKEEQQIIDDRKKDILSQQMHQASQDAWENHYRKIEEEIKNDQIRRMQQNYQQQKQLVFEMDGWQKNNKFQIQSARLIINQTEEELPVRMTWSGNNMKIWHCDFDVNQIVKEKRFRQKITKEIVELEQVEIEDLVIQKQQYLLYLQENTRKLNISDWLNLAIICMIKEMSIQQCTLQQATDILIHNLKEIIYKISGENNVNNNAIWQRVAKEMQSSLQVFKDWLKQRGRNLNPNLNDKKELIVKMFHLNQERRQLVNIGEEEFGLVTKDQDVIRRIKDIIDMKQQYVETQINKYFCRDEKNSEIILHQIKDHVIQEEISSERPVSSQKDNIGKQLLKIENQFYNKNISEDQEWIEEERNLQVFNTIADQNKIRNKYQKHFKVNGMTVVVNSTEWKKEFEGTDSCEQQIQTIIDLETQQNPLLNREWLLYQTNNCLDWLWGRCNNIQCKDFHDSNARGLLSTIFHEKLKYNKMLRQDELNKNKPFKELLYGDFESMIRENNSRATSNNILRIEEQQSRALAKFVQNQNEEQKDEIDLKIVHLVQNLSEVGNWSCHSMEHMEYMLECLYSQHQNMELRNKDDERWAKTSVGQRKMVQIKEMQLQMAFLICEILNWRNSNHEISQEEQAILNQNLEVPIDFTVIQNKFELIRWRHHYMIAWMQTLQRFFQNQNDIKKRGQEYLDWDLQDEIMQKNVSAMIQNLETATQENFMKIFQRNQEINRVPWQQNMGVWVVANGKEIIMKNQQRLLFENLNLITCKNLNERKTNRNQYLQQRNLVPNANGKFSIEILPIIKEKLATWRNLMYRNKATPGKNHWRLLQQVGGESDKIGWDWFDDNSVKILEKSETDIVDYTNSLRVVRLDQSMTIEVILELLDNWHQFQPDIGDQEKSSQKWKEIIQKKVLDKLNLQQVRDVPIKVILPFEWNDELESTNKFREKQCDEILCALTSQLEFYNKRIMQQYRNLAIETNERDGEGVAAEWNIPLTNMRNIQRSIKRQKFNNTKIALARSWIQGFDYKMNIQTATQIINNLSHNTGLQMPSVFNVHQVIRWKEKDDQVTLIDITKFGQDDEIFEKWKNIRKQAMEDSNILKFQSNKNSMKCEGEISWKLTN